jgi:hypothetical protein
MPFTISTATVTGVAPAMAALGASVTISGSGFGASQGTGQAWLGGAIATIQSWSDGQIVAQVPAGTTGTGARVLQNGVMSNAGTFTVDALLLTGILPMAGSNPPSLTLTGTGFGTAPGMVWLGDKAGSAVSWTDTQVVATADPSAKSGVAKIQQNGLWSNAKPFIVAVPGGGNTVVPSAINMVVGDTRSLQALNASSQPVTGLTWTSSNPNIVRLSTDDPPVLTALAAGNVTITAGTGSADVTVWAGAPSIGTVVWSSPGNASGVARIVPAVPSTSGVADVFAFQNDGTVQAIASDGTTAWTANIGQPSQALPDFQGGLVVATQSSVYKLDGITGQAYPAYTYPSGLSPGSCLVGATQCSNACASFFSEDPTRNTYFSGLTAAVTRQLPFDGVQTNISLYKVGFVSAADLANLTDPGVARFVKIAKSAPVCSLFFPKWRAPGNRSGRTPHVSDAAAGGTTDMYINTNRYYAITQGTILHEALHNLTGMYDFDPDYPKQSLARVAVGLETTRRARYGLP